MDDVPLAYAKVHLSQLVDRVGRGAEIRITKRGKPVAHIVAIDRPPKPIDPAALRALTDAMPPQSEPARDWVRQVRDDARY